MDYSALEAVRNFMKRIQEEENIQLRFKSLERSCRILGICNILLVVGGIRLVFLLAKYL